MCYAKYQVTGGHQNKLISIFMEQKPFTQPREDRARVDTNWLCLIKYSFFVVILGTEPHWSPLMKRATFRKDTQGFCGIPSTVTDTVRLLGPVIGPRTAINLHRLILLFFHTSCQPPLGLRYSLFLCSPLIGTYQLWRGSRRQWSTSRLWSPKAQI